jgi:hypothetical protein
VRSKSLAAPQEQQVKNNVLLPSLKLFDNQKDLTGSEYRFFNELLGNSKDRNGKDEISAKSLLQR